MAIIVIFVLGILNFAMHAAVLGSRNAMLSQVPEQVRRRGRWITLGIEFVVLVGAMLLAAGSAVWALAYGAYTAGNAVAAYLVLRGRF